jgi:hypothetical protein
VHRQLSGRGRIQVVEGRRCIVGLGICCVGKPLQAAAVSQVGGSCLCSRSGTCLAAALACVRAQVVHDSLEAGHASFWLRLTWRLWQWHLLLLLLGRVRRDHAADGGLLRQLLHLAALLAAESVQPGLCMTHGMSTVTVMLVWC